MKALYTIGMLSVATGVPPSTLRAWERRYGVPQPQRSAKGRRQYDERQLDIVRQLVSRLGQGDRISNAVECVMAGGAVDPAVTHVAAGQVGVGSYWAHMQARMIECVERFDEETLNALFGDALAGCSARDVTDRLLVPVLRMLGERWRDRATGIAEEHFFSGYLRARLGLVSQFQLARSPRRPRILACCLPDEVHEVGLLMFCMEAEARGVRCVFLGGRTPLQQIELVAGNPAGGFDAVVISATMEPPSDLFAGLAALTRVLPLPVFVGGANAVVRKDAFVRAGLHPLGTDIGTAVSTLLRFVGPQPRHVQGSVPI